MTLLSSIRFDNLDLPDSLREGIRASGFDQATLVQAQVLPLALAGKDVAAQAQTGTGKTAAFLIAGMNRLLRIPRREGAPGPRFLIVAPTRELVVQIADDARRLAASTGLTITAVYGGIDYARQRDEVRRNPDILVGSPGRLLDYEDQRATTFRSVEVLVLDEADRMFDLGFLRDIRRIFRKCPPYNRRQSMLFSATLSPRATELAYEHMNDAVRVSIEPEQITAQGIRELLYHVASHEKLRLLLGLIERDRFDRTLIFVNRKDTAAELETRLAACGVTAAVLAGNVRQQRRLRILNDFKEGKLAVMIATDVASRGLHIEGVTHVINFDLPQDPEDYVHRVGRTARAGASGDAISFADEEYVFSLDGIEKLLGRKIPSEMADPSLFRELPKEAAARPRPQHRRPSRPPGPGGPRGPRGPHPGARRPTPARPPAGKPAASPGVTYGRGRGTKAR